MSGSTRVSRYQRGKTKKVKTNLDLLEQEIVSGSVICWAICKSAPHADNHANTRPRNRSSRAKRSIHGNLCPTQRSTRLSSNLSTRLDSAQLVSTVIDSIDMDALHRKGREWIGATPEGSSGGAKGQCLRRRVMRSASRGICTTCNLTLAVNGHSPLRRIHAMHNLMLLLVLRPRISNNIKSYLTSGNNRMLINLTRTGC